MIVRCLCFTARCLLVTAGILVACGPAHASSRLAVAPSAVTVSFRPASPAIAACLPSLRAKAIVEPGPTHDTLTLQATGLPPFSGFDLFVTALPHPPYGPSWLLSQLQADGQGTADVRVQAILLGAFRLNGSTGTPDRVQTSHLVIVFDRAGDADRCFGTVAPPTTQFTNGRPAGPAVLATTGYADAAGPLHDQPFPLPGLGISTPGGGHRAQGTPVIFTSSCTDPAGWTAVRFVDFRLTKGGRTAFWARLDRPARRMYVYDSATQRWIGGGRPGSAGVLTSQLAQLHLAGSKVIGSAGATGKVVWDLAFSKEAAGQTFQQSVQVTDMRNQTRGWNASGTWTVDS